jgi:predicted DNA-binding transcriptional regulator YafY
MNTKFVLVASPKTLKLKYKKRDGTIRDYPKVLPMEVASDRLIAYVFGTEEHRPGIRRFNQDGILDIQEV